MTPKVYHRFMQEYAILLKVKNIYPDGVRYKWQAVELARRCQAYGWARVDFSEIKYISSSFVKALKAAFDKYAPLTVVNFENMNWTKYDKKLYTEDEHDE